MAIKTIPRDLRQEYGLALTRLQISNPTCSLGLLEPYALKIVRYNMMVEWETFKVLHYYEWGIKNNV